MKYVERLEAALYWLDPHLIAGQSDAEVRKRAEFAWEDFQRARRARDYRRREAAQAVRDA